MKKTSTPAKEITKEEVEHLREQALKVHRRYLVNEEDSTLQMYKRLASVWMRAKQKYDSQLAARSQKSLF